METGEYKDNKSLQPLFIEEAVKCETTPTFSI